MPREWLFRLIAVLLILAATYHAVGFLAPALGIPGVRWRHALFVSIDLLCAWYVLRRPLWFVAAFSLLALQQLYSHSTRAWVWWHMERRLDWVSILVIALTPLALVLLIKDAHDRRSRPKA